MTMEKRDKKKQKNKNRKKHKKKRKKDYCAVTECTHNLIVSHNCVSFESSSTSIYHVQVK